MTDTVRFIGDTFAGEADAFTRDAKRIALMDPTRAAFLMTQLNVLIGQHRAWSLKVVPDDPTAFTIEFTPAARSIMTAIRNLEWQAERDALRRNPVRQELLPGAGPASTVPGPVKAHLPAETRASSSLFSFMERILPRSVCDLMRERRNASQRAPK
jgi:hypothetical protein